MAAKNPDKPKPESTRVSLAPFTSDQALAAAPLVTPADMKRLEAGEKKAKGKTRGSR